VTVRLEDATRAQLLTALRSLLDERDELQRRIDVLETAHERLGREHAALEREHAIVSQLHVAARLIHGSLDRRRVIGAIVEICINLVGTEEVALFERDDEQRRWRLVGSFGVDEVAYASLPIDHGAFGATARTGAVQLMTSAADHADAATADGGLAACVPLRADAAVVGLLVVFRLLPHKAGFEPVDLALFDLLSQQGGIALAVTAEQR
jgi:GAF domain